MEFRKKEAGEEGDICAWIYLLDVLQESEKIIKYKDGNKIIGNTAWLSNDRDETDKTNPNYEFVKEYIKESKKSRLLGCTKEEE